MNRETHFCVVVVFNHRFDKNLPVLRDLYRGRFPAVRFLVPFYRGDDPDVIPVFESSATFQGYFAQARERLQGKGFSHYIFIADDLLLDPAINETNFATRFRLGPGVGYTKYLKPFTAMTSEWTHFERTLRALRFDAFVNARAELPESADALARLASHGLSFEPLGWRNLQIGPGPWAQKARDLLAAAALIYRSGESRELAYPLVMGYADFLVVPAAAMAEFCHLCGVFAAMGVFVECAAPTALALAVPDLRVEADLPTRGLELWSDQDRWAFMDRHEMSLPRVMADFPTDALYVHPIKFSQWSGSARREG